MIGGCLDDRDGIFAGEVDEVAREGDRRTGFGFAALAGRRREERGLDVIAGRILGFGHLELAGIEVGAGRDVDHQVLVDVDRMAHLGGLDLTAGLGDLGRAGGALLAAIARDLPDVVARDCDRAEGAGVVVLVAAVALDASREPGDLQIAADNLLDGEGAGDGMLGVAFLVDDRGAVVVLEVDGTAVQGDCRVDQLDASLFEHHRATGDRHGATRVVRSGLAVARGGLSGVHDSDHVARAALPRDAAPRHGGHVDGDAVDGRRAAR